MNLAPPHLDPGLYLIATPLGAARDITLRALDLLAAADVIAAEDTRSLRRLMALHSVAVDGRPVLSYHDHNAEKARPRLLREIAAGKAVLYAAEAGTPMIADPGYDLARAVVAAGHPLVSAPGPSAVLAALTLSGLPTDRFLFAGFLPNASSRRRAALQELAGVPATLVFYESPKRIAATLHDAVAVLGGDRPAALCREITKKFEETRRGTLAELAEGCADTPPRGEIVLIVGKGDSENVREVVLEDEVRAACAGRSLRDAVDLVVARTGLPRRRVYQAALRYAKDE